MAQKKYQLEPQDRNLILMLISEKTKACPEWARDEDPIRRSICRIIDCFEHDNKALNLLADKGTQEWIEEIDKELDL